MTTVLFSPLGGVVADGCDRRRVMIWIDLAGAFVAWWYVLAVDVFQSIPMIFIATFAQEILGGLYGPSRSALLPLLVNNEDEPMKKATIIFGMSWSAVAAFGSALGGLLISLVGIRACFAIDSFTYLLSAVLMYMVGDGKWDVSKIEQEQNEDKEGQKKNDEGHMYSVLHGIRVMVWDGLCYLYTSFWGPIVLFKFSVLWLTLDVVNVKLSSAGGTGDETEDSYRLGLLFGGVGVGCFVGPLVAERWTRMERPKSLQTACFVSMGVAAVACLVMGIPTLSFGWLVLMTAIRASGVSVVWINSSLLLQKFSAPNFLGRVSSLDYAFALTGESSAAILSGRLEDKAGFTAHQVCTLLGVLGLVLLCCWTVFHVQGGGAAAERDADLVADKQQQQRCSSDVETAFPSETKSYQLQHPQHSKA